MMKMSGSNEKKDFICFLYVILLIGVMWECERVVVKCEMFNEKS